MFKFLFRKIQFQTYSDRSHGSGSHSISVFTIGVLAVMLFLGIMGVVTFDKDRFLQSAFPSKRDSLAVENEQLSTTVKQVYDQIQSSKLEIEAASKIKGDVQNLADLPKQRERVHSDFSQNAKEGKTLAGENLQRIRRSHALFSHFLESLKANEDVAARIPILHPVSKHHNISARFEMVKDRFTGQRLPHYGIDFATIPGDTVFAPGNGTVTEVKFKKGFGMTVTISHLDHVSTFYAHLNEDVVFAKLGQSLKRGEPIGLVGMSGRASGPHLHYEVRVNDTPIDPELFFITR